MSGPSIRYRCAALPFADVPQTPSKAPRMASRPSPKPRSFATASRPSSVTSLVTRVECRSRSSTTSFDIWLSRLAVALAVQTKMNAVRISDASPAVSPTHTTHSELALSIKTITPAPSADRRPTPTPISRRVSGGKLAMFKSGLRRLLVTPRTYRYLDASRG